VRFLSQTSSELQKAKPLPRLLVGLLTLQDIFYLNVCGVSTSRLRHVSHDADAGFVIFKKIDFSSIEI